METKGQPQFKSTRSPGRKNSKKSNADSGKPSAQYKQQAPAATWKADGKADSGKPNANK